MAGPYANGLELKNAVLAWSARDDASDKVAEFLRLCEIQLERDLKARYLAVTIEDALTAGDPLLVLPDDCLEPRRLILLTNPERRIEIVSVEEFSERRSADLTDYPTCAVFEELSLRLAPTPAEAYDYQLFYHARITGLTDGTSTWLLEHAPDVLLYGTLVQLCRYFRDWEGVAAHQDVYNAAKKELRLSEWRAKYSAGHAVMRPEGRTP